MSLRFVLGRAGSGKTTFCLDEMKNELIEAPNGDPIVYLVPDQMTFQSEYELINTPNLGGMIRAQVFSFTRLAWRVLQETGGITRYHLNGVGINMLLRKIVEQKKDDLKVFKRASEQNGFIDQLEQLFTEFKRYCISPEDLLFNRKQLEEQMNLDQNEEILKNKLQDFQTIYQEFEHQLLSKYIDSEDYLRLLAESVSKSTYLQNTHFYVDGFHSFTPQELLVLEQLLKVSKNVTITLTLDRPYDEFVPHELHLYQMPGRTYQQLKKMAEEQNIEIEGHVDLNKSVPKRFQHEPSIAHIERFYDTRPVETFNDTAAVDLVSAVNRRAEVEGVARQIIHLVREKGYRWRDIIILMRNSEAYHDLIETLFQDHSIPVFIDQKRSMLNHPLIEFIRSSLDIVKTNWRYESVFRFIKTELLFPKDADFSNLRESMDELENYVLAYGIKGDRWKNDRPWTYRRYQPLDGDGIPQTDKEKQFEDKINQLRNMIVPPVQDFESQMKTAKTAREMCEILFYHLEGLEVHKKVEKFRDQAEEKGDLQKAREHDQVWEAIIELLDQMVELMGDEEISFDDFRNMIEAGLENMKFSLVPPAMDQILVGDIEHSRFLNVKCTFILGANDGVLPAKPKEDSVISEDERELLRDRGVELAPGSTQQLLDENFIIYLGLTSPSHYLWLSYAMADEEGKSLVPSILMSQMKQMFPNVQEKLILNEPGEEEDEAQLRYLATPSRALSYLAAQIQTWKKGYPVSNIWWDAYNWYIQKESWKLTGQRILSSLFYRNAAKSLAEGTSRELYGTHLKASVSRMEKFQACAFQHFASNGLRLKEREVFQLEAPDIGQLFHAALKLMADHLRESNKEWGRLTKEECNQLAENMVDRLAPKIQREILLSSHRYHYIKRKLQQVVGRASMVLRDHAKASGFSPVGLEIGFGQKEDLPPITFTLKNGCTMELVGRIDRVDKAETANGVMLRIIDYKSSQTALNLDEVYFGLALQMLTYLDVVITHSQEWLGVEAGPAGVLYFHVHNPIINKSFIPKKEQIDEELFKKFKMKGLLAADEQVVGLMDDTLEPGKSSNIIPAGLKKDGDFNKNSSIASKEDFEYLQEYVQNMIQQIGQEITEGKVDVNPYKLKNHVPCRFCSYKSVCQFDLTLEENEYRNLQSQKPEDILKQIRLKGGEDGE